MISRSFSEFKEGMPPEYGLNRVKEESRKDMTFGTGISVIIYGSAPGIMQKEISGGTNPGQVAV